MKIINKNTKIVKITDITISLDNPTDVFYFGKLLVFAELRMNDLSVTPPKLAEMLKYLMEEITDHEDYPEEGEINENTKA